MRIDRHHRTSIGGKMFKTIVIGLVLAFLPLRAAIAEPAGVDERCGGRAGIQCAEGLWCDPPKGMCGGADLIGTCVKIHRLCHHNLHLICGCNGVTYGNDCERRNESVAEDHVGRCSSDNPE
jgi:hypothetical protein